MERLSFDLMDARNAFLNLLLQRILCNQKKKLIEHKIKLEYCS